VSQGKLFQMLTTRSVKNEWHVFWLTVWSL